MAGKLYRTRYLCTILPGFHQFIGWGGWGGGGRGWTRISLCISDVICSHPKNLMSYPTSAPPPPNKAMVYIEGWRLVKYLQWRTQDFPGGVNLPFDPNFSRKLYEHEEIFVWEGASFMSPPSPLKIRQCIGESWGILFPFGVKDAFNACIKMSYPTSPPTTTK